MASDEPFLLKGVFRGHKEKERQHNGQRERGVIRGHKEKKGRYPSGQKRKGSSEVSVLLFMTSDDPFLFCPLGCLSSLWPRLSPLSFVHWVVCPSSPYDGQKREGSSETIKRRRTDNIMEKRERIHQRP
jgi:hypothetical protein